MNTAYGGLRRAHSSIKTERPSGYASNPPYGPDSIAIYARRWEIETLFSCLKGRGFNLEDTRVTDRARIKRLLVVPVIAFCWAHRTGEWRHESIKPIKIKKHKRLAKSYFKYGLDWIRDNLLKTTDALSATFQPFLQAIDNIEPVYKA